MTETFLNSIGDEKNLSLTIGDQWKARQIIDRIHKWIIDLCHITQETIFTPATHQMIESNVGGRQT